MTRPVSPWHSLPTGRGRLFGAKGMEAAITLVLRLFVGLLLSLVLGFVGGVLGWLTLRSITPVPTFIWLAVLSVGFSSGLGAVLAWWKHDLPAVVKSAYVASIFVAANASALISFQLFGGGGYFVWFPEAGSVRILHLGQNLGPILVGAVLGSNLGGGLVWLYHALRFRDW